MFPVDWLKPCVGDNAKAYCKTDIVAHRKSIKDHGNTKKHIDSAKNEKACLRIPKIHQFAVPTIDEKRKIAELKLAAYVSEHSSVNAIDHLSTVVKDLDPDSPILSKIKLHRTKCTGLIVNVLSPCMLQDLFEDLGDSYYSLIIDESTLIDTTKVMCVMIRYFSIKLRQIRTTFYRLIHLQSGTAESMTESFKDQLKKDGLNMTKIIGIGVDGANSMIGEHNSFGSRLREIIPHLVTVKCLCHSLHLAAEKACDVLPRNLDYLVETSHSWFSRSTKRTIEFADLYKTITGKMPTTIPKLSGTRWLARFEAIQILIAQWDEYKLYFELEKSKTRCSSGYTAEELWNMFKKDENKLYLLFIRDVLKDVINLNKLFQSSAVEPFKLFTDLNFLMFSTLQRIIVPHQLDKVKNQDLASYDFKKYVMMTDCINFGFYFNELSGKINNENLKVIKERCKEFLIKLTEELQKRIPTNLQILEKICVFSPENARNSIKPDITDIAVTFKAICSNIESTNTEWSLVHRVEVDAVTSDEFWGKLNLISDSAGQKRFPHISNLALALLSLPFSNASVERAFSIVNVVKDKLRNKLLVKTIDAIVRVRFSVENKCHTFRPTPAMLRKFVSEVVYSGEMDDGALNILDNYDMQSQLCSAENEAET